MERRRDAEERRHPRAPRRAFQRHEDRTSRTRTAATGCSASPGLAQGPASTLLRFQHRSTRTRRARRRTCRISDDGGATWGELFTIDAGEGNLGVSHGVFLSHKGVLWAFIGAFLRRVPADPHPRLSSWTRATGAWQPRGVVDRRRLLAHAGAAEDGGRQLDHGRRAGLERLRGHGGQPARRRHQPGRRFHPMGVGRHPSRSERQQRRSGANRR